MTPPTPPASPHAYKAASLHTYTAKGMLAQSLSLFSRVFHISLHDKQKRAAAPAYRAAEIFVTLARQATLHFTTPCQLSKTLFVLSCLIIFGHFMLFFHIHFFFIIIDALSRFSLPPLSFSAMLHRPHAVTVTNFCLSGYHQLPLLIHH